MKKVVKLLALCSAVAVLGSALASCKADPAAGKTVIQFWHPFGGATQKEIVDEWIEGFNSSQDKYYVKPSYISDVGQKLLTFSTGDAENVPDVCHFDRYRVQEWAAQGLFADITDMIEASDIDTSRYYDYAWAESVYKDRAYCLPWDVDNRQLFLNNKMLRSVGLDPNNPPTTVAQLEEWGPKMDKKVDQRWDTLGFIPWLDEGSVLTWTYAWGGNFEDPETHELTPDGDVQVEVLEWMKPYATKYGMAAVSAFSSTASAISPFASNKLGMIVSGSWKVKQYDTIEGLDYTICPIPNKDGKDFKTWGGGTSLIMPANAKNKEGAFEFMKYCCYGDGALASVKHPGTFSALEDLNAQQDWVNNSTVFKLFVDSMPTTQSRPQFAKNDYYMGQIGKVQDKALRKDIDIRSELAKVKQNTLEELEKLEKTQGN